MRFLLILLMVGLPVFAQVMLPARRIVPNQPISDAPTNSVYHWWVYSDENTNFVGLSTWTDRIQGLQMVQATAGSQPQNTPLGVYVTVGKFMTNVALADWTNYTFAMIVDPRDQASSMGHIWGFPPYGSGRGLGLGSTTNWVADLNGVIYPLSATLPVGLMYDLVLTGSNTGSNRVLVAYTNAVQSYTAVHGLGVSEFPMTRLGDDGFGDVATAFVREILVWTNALSQAQVDWFHAYRTNTYPTYSSSTLNTSLIAYWKMDEASGTRRDYKLTSGTAQDLTDNNTVTSVAGLIKNAAEFSAVNSEFLSRADSAELSTGNIDYTIAAWFSPSVLGVNQYVVSKSNGASDEYGVHFLATDELEYWTWNPSGYQLVATVGFVPNTNTTHLVVAWHNAAAGTINIQVDNGTIFSASTGGLVPQDTTDDFVVGAYASGNSHFSGWIDEVPFWKKVLTVAERLELYNAGAGKTYLPFINIP